MALLFCFVEKFPLYMSKGLHHETKISLQNRVDFYCYLAGLNRLTNWLRADRLCSGGMGVPNHGIDVAVCVDCLVLGTAADRIVAVGGGAGRAVESALGHDHWRQRRWTWHPGHRSAVFLRPIGKENLGWDGEWLFC